MRERTHLEADIESCRAMAKELAESIELIELGEAEDDQDLIADAEADLAALERRGQPHGSETLPMSWRLAMWCRSSGLRMARKTA